VGLAWAASSTAKSPSVGSCRVPSAAHNILLCRGRKQAGDPVVCEYGTYPYNNIIDYGMAWVAVTGIGSN